MLHVTNGDAASDLLRESGVDGEVLPWRDALHDGPLPAVDGDALRRCRAAFIAARGEADAATIESDLHVRDEQLADAARGPVVLWFEADLHDQLQILQIVAQLDAAGAAPDEVSIVCIDRHPALVRFPGLAELAPADVAALFADRRPIDPTAWRSALATWDAVRAPEPGDLQAAAATIDRDAWPFLGDALVRWLHEYPGIDDGLSLTQRRILAGIADGVHDPLRLFRRVNAQEPRPFLGDHGYAAALTVLADAEVPLLHYVGGSRRARPGAQTLSLTPAGRAALAGAHDHVLASGIDRWLGGVHLTGAPDWRHRPVGEVGGELVAR
jgi:hypothetical protein